VDKLLPNNGNEQFNHFDKLEKVDEYRVEMVVKDELIKTAVAAFLNVHPYEEPAYSVLKIEQQI
jgi:hypothetical protein